MTSESHTPAEVKGGGATPPDDAQSILEQVGRQKADIYHVVRGILEDLEGAAPWQLLYYPSDDHNQFLQMQASLVEVLEGIPGRIEPLLERLRGDSGELDPHSHDDIDFYFTGIHGMVERDLASLKEVLAPLKRRFVSTIEEKANVCEIGSDLKGKYSSALMAAAASILAEGLWNNVEVEQVLFPEKREEARLSRHLQSGLDELVEALENLGEGVPFSELHERWQRQERADIYALADLHSLVGRIGRLLQSGSRRGLYSGDYHRISRREAILSERLSRLETLHRATWTEQAPALWGGNQDVYARMRELLLEIVAVLDLGQLGELMGQQRLEKLCRLAEEMKASSEDDEALDATATEDSPEAELHFLLPLLEEDLRTFLGRLHLAVRKRQSLADSEAGSGGEAEEEGEAGDVLKLEPLPDEPLPALEPVDEEEAEEGPAAKPQLDAEPDAELTAEQLDAVAAVNRSFEALRSVKNPKWSAFRMTERLLSKHGRIPPGMFSSTHGFLEELAEETIPSLEGLVGIAGVSSEHLNTLRAYCANLRHSEISPARLQGEIPATMKRLIRLLDALEATIGDTLKDHGR